MTFDKLLFGYKRISFSDKDRFRVLSQLLNNRLYASIGKEPFIDVFVFSSRRYIKALCGIDITVSELRGLGGLALRFKRRWGAIAALLCLGVYFFVVSQLVWDVRVSGNVNMSDEQVRTELSRAGLGVGACWRKLSLDKVEGKLLASSDTIGWININRRGSVAYVKLRDKDIPPDGDTTQGYSNIYATEDATVTDITVRSGVAAVKVGDTVKAGDILISGIIPAEVGGGFVRASGTVVGRTVREFQKELSREQTQSYTAEGELYGCELNIFNFSINIFKKYRKSTDGCVIIDKTTDFCLPGGTRLPFGMVKNYLCPVYERQVTYTDSELVQMAREQIAGLFDGELYGAEPIRLQTEGELNDKGYTLYGTAVILTCIGKEEFFFVGN